MPGLRAPGRHGRLTCTCMCRICILAGDISPIDVITHIPILCEDSGIPYIYVPSKEVLVAAPSCANIAAALPSLKG